MSAKTPKHSKTLDKNAGTSSTAPEVYTLAVGDNLEPPVAPRRKKSKSFKQVVKMVRAASSTGILKSPDKDSITSGKFIVDQNDFQFRWIYTNYISNNRIRQFSKNRHRYNEFA